MINEKYDVGFKSRSNPYVIVINIILLTIQFLSYLTRDNQAGRGFNIIISIIIFGFMIYAVFSFIEGLSSLFYGLFKNETYNALLIILITIITQAFVYYVYTEQLNSKKTPNIAEDKIISTTDTIVNN